ncbi:MAG: hypothetical protein GX575_16085 [Candidatus Anammoximicrobium sp.]|nr:hypothetical protein [Candidatus Anammoximicrobium sp.]
MAERAGISFLDATKLSLFDLVLLATAGRAAGQAAGAATGQATGQGEGDPASRDVQDGGDVSEDQDGPLPPNRFRFNGTCHNMRPVPWKLLYAMWGRESRHVNDVEAEVWEDSLPPEKTGTTMYRVNKVLEKAGYPSKLSRCADFLTWVSAEFPK